MEKRRAFGRPSLGPYLPGRPHLRRVLRGAVILARRAWRSGRAALRRASTPPQQGEKPSAFDGLERAGVATLIVLVTGAAGAGAVRSGWPVLHPYAPVLSSVAAVALLTAAWVAGPETPDEPGEDAGEKSPVTPKPAAGGGAAQAHVAPLPQPEPLTVDQVAAVVRQLATPHGWKGAHLDDVLAHLPGRSRTELLQVLADARIPVTEQLKLMLPGGKQRNRQGIRLDTLPAAPEQAPAAPATTPPQPAAEAPPEPLPRVPHLTVHGNQ